MPRRRRYSYRRGPGSLSKMTGELLGDLLVDAIDAKVAQEHERDQREKRLLEMASVHAKYWNSMEDMLLGIKSAGFGDKALDETRRVARDSRIESIRMDSRNRISRSDPGIYKPILDVFDEMYYSEEEVWNSVLRACDTRNPQELDYALSTIRYCQAQAEKALLMVPDIVTARKAKEASDNAAVKKGCLWAIAIWLGISILMAVFCGAN